MSVLFYICSNKFDKMKNSLLLPNKYKVLGWILFLAFAALGMFCMLNNFKIPGFDLNIFNVKTDGIADFRDFNLTNELAFLGITVGLLMVVFAKEKIEDELITVLRLKSLQWAVLISYVILIVLNFSVFGLPFLMMLVYNLWTVLIVFIIKFNIALFKLKKEEVVDEK